MKQPKNISSVGDAVRRTVTATQKIRGLRTRIASLGTPAELKQIFNRQLNRLELKRLKTRGKKRSTRRVI